jgi:hypothetical protein
MLSTVSYQDMSNQGVSNQGVSIQGASFAGGQRTALHGTTAHGARTLVVRPRTAPGVPAIRPVVMGNPAWGPPV